MTQERRRLAAIVAADVVGYSRLVGRDEAGTLARLRAHRVELIDPTIRNHEGRIVKTMGDGLLLEFPSVVEATRCAAEVQVGMASRNIGVPDTDRIVLRMGINLGDVVIDGDDILGDGVNIAARLQEIAEPGGIAVSARVHEDVRDRLALPFTDAGELNLKNIARPVRVWRLLPSGAQAADPALTLPDRPSIVVLPFQNMSAEPGQDYFVDGMVEEITMALSRLRWLFVIARNSAFTYKGRAIDVKQVGRELGVRYALEGSVRRAGNRVRFTAQLIDTTNGSHVWADRQDGDIADVFELQDRITESVVGVLEPAIQQAEIERIRRKRPESLDAYDYYLRSLAVTNTFTRESVEAMMSDARRAVELDPTFAPAYAQLVTAYLQRHAQGWITDEAKEYAEALDATERGLSADSLDSVMLGMAGNAFAYFGRDLAKGVSYADRAIGINPNNARALSQSANIRVRLGETRVAIEHLDRALRLSPRDPWSVVIYQTMAMAHLVDGRVQVACEWARRAVQHSPNFVPALAVLAASAAALGNQSEARDAARRLMDINPRISIMASRHRHPVGAPEKFDIYFDGLRDAGIPE